MPGIGKGERRKTHKGGGGQGERGSAQYTYYSKLVTLVRSMPGPGNSMLRLRRLADSEDQKKEIGYRERIVPVVNVKE